MTSEPSKNGVASVVVRLNGRLPSWNQILAMNQWDRHRYKKQTLAVLLSECAKQGIACSTRIIQRRNFSSTRFAMQDSSLTIVQTSRKSKSRNGNAPKGKKNT